VRLSSSSCQVCGFSYDSKPALLNLLRQTICNDDALALLGRSTVEALRVRVFWSARPCSELVIEPVRRMQKGSQLERGVQQAVSPQEPRLLDLSGVHVRP